MMAGGAILQMAGSILGQRADVGGLVYLIVGIGVLFGSQAGVRFAAFFGSLMMLLFTTDLVWSLAMARPVEVDGKLLDPADLRFWTVHVCPAVYVFAEGLLAFAVLKQRQLSYWTRVVKVSTVVLGCLFLVKATLAAASDVKGRQTIRMFPKEVAMAEDYLLTHGARISSSATDRPQEELKALPALHSIAFFQGEAMGWDWTSSASVPAHQIRKGTHWVKLPSGEWGKIEFGFIAPMDGS